MKFIKLIPALLIAFTLVTAPVARADDHAKTSAADTTMTSADHEHMAMGDSTDSKVTDDGKEKKECEHCKKGHKCKDCKKDGKECKHCKKMNKKKCKMCDKAKHDAESKGGAKGDSTGKDKDEE